VFPFLQNLPKKIEIQMITLIDLLRLVATQDDMSNPIRGVRTPTPAGPVPIPYPNTDKSQASSAKKHQSPDQGRNPRASVGLREALEKKR
jgi:hypothetical protein